MTAYRAPAAVALAAVGALVLLGCPGAPKAVVYDLAARAAVAEASANRAYWYGDFYPLTPARAGGDVWAAWQLHRADLGAGIVLAFRRADCPYPALQVSLRALPPDGRYAVEFVDEEYAVTSRRLSGAELASGFELRLPRPATSMLVRYVPER